MPYHHVLERLSNFIETDEPHFGVNEAEASEFLRNQNKDSLRNISNLNNYQILALVKLSSKGLYEGYFNENNWFDTKFHYDALICYVENLEKIGEDVVDLGMEYALMFLEGLDEDSLKNMLTLNPWQFCSLKTISSSQSIRELDEHNCLRAADLIGKDWFNSEKHHLALCRLMSRGGCSFSADRAFKLLEVLTPAQLKDVSEKKPHNSYPCYDPYLLKKNDIILLEKFPDFYSRVRKEKPLGFNSNASLEALHYLKRKEELAALPEDEKEAVSQASEKYKIEIIRQACLGYLDFRRECAPGSRFRSITTHWSHGTDGKKRVERILETINKKSDEENEEKVNYSEILELTKTAYDKSGNNRNSFKNYFLVEVNPHLQRFKNTFLLDLWPKISSELSEELSPEHSWECSQETDGGINIPLTRVASR